MKLAVVLALIAGCGGGIGPADCAEVAEQLASVELGNYAELEVREPVVAKYQAACVAHHVTWYEADCIGQAKDRWSSARCVRRMFPEMGLDGDCGEVTAVLGRAWGTSMAQNPQSQTILRAMRDSCELDHWPDELKECLLASGTAMNACTHEMTPELTRKMTERMTQALTARSIPGMRKTHPLPSTVTIPRGRP